MWRRYSGDDNDDDDDDDDDDVWLYLNFVRVVTLTCNANYAKNEGLVWSIFPSLYPPFTSLPHPCGLVIDYIFRCEEQNVDNLGH